jgi:ergothioneine biosynthesis protein EgtB
MGLQSDAGTDLTPMTLAYAPLSSTDPGPIGLAHPALVASLRGRLRQVRQHSVDLIEPLQPEDLCLQGMADASPPKWHLGHTTWFFETFLLAPHLAGWQGADPRWGYLFNSYYDAVGARHPRPERGLLTRPSIKAVLAWRRRVDQGLEDLLDQLEQQPPAQAQPLLALLELGLQHEQQHQELLLMDLLDGFSRNPLEPVYRDAVEGPEPSDLATSDGAASWRATSDQAANLPLTRTSEAAASLMGAAAGTPAGSPWRAFEGGLVEIGHDPGDPGFHFDNEAPRHRQWLERFEIATALVSNGELEAFIADGGYQRPELWMSEGWATLQQRHWQAPRYWRGDGEFSLAGLRPRRPEASVRHLSWFEADAYARWAGARLPSEAEWEHANRCAPLPQAFGALWQWTASPYRPYPGFSPAAGAVGEYNGKFMSSQFVLRGSCYLTPAGHDRLTYRNFFPPASRWMAAGLRLAR